MIYPVYLLYSVCLRFVKFSKWTEFQILKLFKPILVKKSKILLESLGVILHCPDDPKWTKDDEKRVLAQCTKYDKLVHIDIHDVTALVHVVTNASLGAAESYMEKMWDARDGEGDISVIFKRICKNDLMGLYLNPWNRFLQWLELRAFNLVSRNTAFQVAEEHYDLGNDLYETMLDPWMQYSCGYWKDAKDLNEAQVQKLELIAKKLDLRPGMRVLDIGCGWGTTCKYLAENYQVECVGVTVSKEGAEYGQKLCRDLPVDIRCQDYRDVNEKFDRIVSVGMFEHVGFWNYRSFFKQVRELLADDGIFLCHTIARNHPNYPAVDTFMHRLIFPNCSIPNPEEMAKATNGVFIIEDWHNFGKDYAKTLRAWRKNFLKGWPNIQNNYDPRFYKMWIYYLSVVEGAFAARRIQLWQIVFSKDGLQREYRAAR